jgi:uncharacterized repeat protein (TIGR03803 family)
MPSGAGYAELYGFRGGNDGAHPVAGLIADGTGALYGTTSSGGKYGAGTVFKLTPAGAGYTESVLHAFKGSPSDGASPFGSLIADRTGTLYGTTQVGGANDAGTVFAISL